MAIVELKKLVDERNLSLDEASQLTLEPEANDQASSVTNYEHMGNYQTLLF